MAPIIRPLFRSALVSSSHHTPLSSPPCTIFFTISMASGKQEEDFSGISRLTLQILVYSVTKNLVTKQEMSPKSFSMTIRCHELFSSRGSALVEMDETVANTFAATAIIEEM